MNATSTDAEPASASNKLRLKKVFLRTLVISLTTCALVAVAALLYGTFSRTTAKVLVTLGALAVHSGFAMACADSLERRRWPALSVVGLVGGAIAFAALITCVWVPGWFDEPTVRAALTSGSLLGYYVLAIPCADLLERRTRRALSTIGLLTCAVGFLMVLVCIWAEPSGNIAFAKATGIVAVVAFSFAQTALLVRIPGAGTIGWLLYGTMVFVWTVAVMVAATIAWELQDDFWFRAMAAAGVLDATGSLALLIMAKLRQVGKVERLTTAPPRVELRCPRCTTLQTVEAGASRCAACGLKFHIEIDEPRCPKCDYLLWQLPDRRCPECGTPF